MVLQNSFEFWSIIMMVIAVVIILSRRWDIFNLLSNVNDPRRRRQHRPYESNATYLRRDSREYFSSSTNNRQRHRKTSSADEEITSPPAYSSASAGDTNERRSVVFKQRLAADQNIVEIILSGNVKTSRYIKKDISEMMLTRKGVTPNQLKIILEGIIKQYQPNTQQYWILEAIINELNTANTGNVPTGQCHLEQVAATSTSGELTATFVAYQYRQQRDPESNTRLLVVDAIIISNSQKLSVELARIAGEIAMLGVLGFLINPALGLAEMVGAIPAILFLDKAQLEVKASTADTHAKALLFKMLIDRGLAQIDENEELYLAIQ